MQLRLQQFVHFCFLFFWLPPDGAGQGIEALPKLLPAHKQEFTQQSGFSRVCSADVFIDSKGKFWVNTCMVERTLYTLPLIQFDGYQYIPVNTSSLKIPDLGWIKFINLTEQDQLIGYYNRDTINTFFKFDLHTQQSEFFPFTKFIPEKGIIRSIYQLSNVQWLFFIKSEGQFWVYEKSQDSLVLKIKIPYPFYSKEVIDLYPGPVLEHGDDIWFMDYQLPLIRWNRKSGKWKQFEREDFPVDLQLNPEYIKRPWATPRPYIEEHKSELILCLPGYTKSPFFKLDTLTDKFVAMTDFPKEWQAEALFKDKTGNLLYFFKNKGNGYEAILEDEKGRQFNYSAIIQGVSHIKKLVADDYKKSLIICSSSGLHVSTVRQSSIIRHYLDDLPIRAITQLSDGRILVSAENNGWFLIDDEKKTVQPFSVSTCSENPFHKQMRRKVVAHSDHTLWTYRADKIYQYDPLLDTCNTYQAKKDIQIFTFLGKDTIAYWNSKDKTLDFIDLKTRQISTYEENGVPKVIQSFVQEIKPSADGQIWITTNNGLWKIDYKNQKSKIIGFEPGFKDYRFITIHEEKNGRLWMGTYMGGLHIYDPASKEVTVLDQGKGLTNNTVVGIIPDEEGDYWICTYNGISIVSANGKIITNIMDVDGLTDGEFNRYAFGKNNTGLLFLGTISGLNIIEAKALKKHLSSNQQPKVYLTEITYFDKAKKRDFSYQNATDLPQVIELKADKRYLKLGFALSSYIQTDKNQYAYKLEGVNKDWIYLGPQRELSLSNLPPGKYKLLLKGANFKGIWNETPLELSIVARDFFYKRPWFQILCFTLISLAAYFWIKYLIEERKRLEKEVYQRTTQIRRDKELLEKQANTLKQMDEMKTRFFTNISHELRTPVTLISTPIEQIIRKHSNQLSKQLSNSLHIVRNNSRKLLNLVEELLELSRLDAEKTQSKAKPVHLLSFCKKLFSAYESNAQIKQIKYQFKYELEESLYLLIDNKRLEKIINNLLSNALKFTPKGGTVMMRVKADFDSAQSAIDSAESALDSSQSALAPRTSPLIIQIQDTGRGIPPEDLPHIFDRYFQTKNPEIPTEGGTGIGLALAKELAGLMQGQLSVKSGWGKGSTFCLTLPMEPVIAKEIFAEKLSAGPLEQLSSTIVDQHTDKTVRADSQKRKILIVEDNPDMQALIQSILSEAYDCLSMNNGVEAWEFLNNGDPSSENIDLILSDVMMPQMDGYKFLDLLKKHPRCQQLPVIMLTARAAEEDKLKALRLGVDDYLIKPFSPEELLVRIENLINNKEQRRHFNDFIKEDISISFEQTGSADEAWLKELEDIIKKALDKKLELNALYLAHEIAVSDRQLLRRIKSLTGLTTKQYIQEVKLQKARHLLENKSFKSIAEIAYACGFNTPGYFTQVFQKRFGKKPKD